MFPRRVKRLLLGGLGFFIPYSPVLGNPIFNHNLSVALQPDPHDPDLKAVALGEFVERRQSGEIEFVRFIHQADPYFRVGSKRHRDRDLDSLPTAGDLQATTVELGEALFVESDPLDRDSRVIQKMELLVFVAPDLGGEFLLGLVNGLSLRPAPWRDAPTAPATSRPRRQMRGSSWAV